MCKYISVFDVDGIIIDSTNECLIISWNAYQEYIGKNKFINSIKEANSDYDTKFRLTRNYVRAMGEYLVVFECQYRQIDSQNEFEKNLSRLEENNIQRYGEIFLKIRNDLKKKS